MKLNIPQSTMRHDPVKQRSNINTAILFIIAITFISFYPVLHADFIQGYDDETYVTANRDIQTLSCKSIKNIFTSSYASMYIPVTMLSYAVEFSLWGFNPHLYHTTNLIIHIINSLLVFWLILLITRSDIFISFLTAVLFAIHPLHVESVAWIAERKDVLCSLFFLSSIISYLFFKRYQYPGYFGTGQLIDIVNARIGSFFHRDNTAPAANHRRRPAINLKPLSYYYLALLFFALSLLSKPMSVSLPFILVLLDIYQNRSFKISEYKEKIPFFALSLLFALLMVFTQYINKSTAINENSNILLNLFVAAHGILFYISKILFPVNLSFIYPYPQTLTPEYLTAPLLLLVFGIITYIAARAYKVVFFGAVFFLIILFPVLQIIHIGEISAADRYTYLPSIGVFYILSASLSRFYEMAQKKNGARLSFIFLLMIGIFILSFSTRKRCLVWNNGLTLWEDVISKYHISSAYNQAGIYYYHYGQHQKAISYYNESLKTVFEQDKVLIHTNRGLAFMALRQYRKAIDDFTYVIKQHEFQLRGIFLSRASCYENLGEMDKAIADYSAAGLLDIYLNNTTLSRSYLMLANTFVNLGNINKSKREHERAELYYKQALKINPLSKPAYYRLADFYLDRDKPLEAVGLYARLLKQYPAESLAYYNRSLCYERLKKCGLARIDAKKAVSLGYIIKSDLSK